MKKRAKMLSILLGTALFCGISGGTALNTTLKSATAEESYMSEQIDVSAKTKQEQTGDNLNLRAKSAYLMDFATETMVYSQNEKTHLPIASMCKIMTLLLSFEAIENGSLDINEEIMVSERAASMGGSQVFLEANAKYSAKELIKSIVVCSANDSCVAMAEKIAGNEDVFIARMNEKAKEIGANDTLFANCTGLPKEPQYSCAKDVAIMLKNLLQYDAYYEFAKVWMDKFAHPEGRYTEITNTNKLVRFYDGCDGGKTGFTNEAGFCLAATAKRGDLRVISVVIGEESSANRFEDVRTMFDYTFANYIVSPIVEGNKMLENEIAVEGGKSKTVGVYPEKSSFAFSRRGTVGNYTTQTHIYKRKAPFKKGETIGEIIVYKDGVESDRISLLAAENVKKATIFDRLREIAREWNGR